MVRSCQLRQFIIDLVDELSPLIGDDDIGAAKPAVIINSEILLSLKVIYLPADKLKNEMGQPLMQDCSGLVKLVIRPLALITCAHELLSLLCHSSSPVEPGTDLLKGVISPQVTTCKYVSTVTQLTVQ